MPRIVVVGAGLAGLAAAARLAKVGHDVTLVERRATLAPPDAPAPLAGPVVLPAAWRDAFAKSGRPLKGTLGTRGLDLVPAPPLRLTLPHAGEIAWPTDRGEQWHVLDAALGRPLADRWRALVDHYDAVWLALRPLGLEAELTGRAPLLATAPVSGKALLPARRTAAQAAAALDDPDLVHLALEPLRRAGYDPDHCPAWLLSRLSVERTFGRWQLADAHGVPADPGHLHAALAERAASLTTVLTSETAATASGRRVDLGARALAADAVLDTRTPAGSDPTWRRPRLPWQPDFHAQLLARPAIRDDYDERLFHAPPRGRGGEEPWAQLLTGALAAYAAHEATTGEDIRPTNRDYRP